jgi:hypothetical protein
LKQKKNAKAIHYYKIITMVTESDSSGAFFIMFSSVDTTGRAIAAAISDIQPDDC